MTLRLTSTTLASLADGTQLIHMYGEDSVFEMGVTYTVQARDFGGTPGFGGYGPVNCIVDRTGDTIVGLDEEEFAKLDIGSLGRHSNLYPVDIFDPITFEIVAPATEVVPDFRGERIVIEQRGGGYTLDLTGEAQRMPYQVGAYSNQADLIAGLKKLFEEGAE